METKPLGEIRVKAGQLLSLYVEDETLPLFVTLYVLKDFNLSEEMADYQEVIRRSRDKSEIVISTFTRHLLEKGLVTEPKSEVVQIGHSGRPPVRMVNEWKYRKNPAEFVLSRVCRVLHTASLYLYNHEGIYVILLDDAASVDTVTLEIAHRGVPVGMVRLGLLTDAGRCVKLNDADLDAIQKAVQDCINEKLTGEEITITRVMASVNTALKRFERVEAIS